MIDEIQSLIDRYSRWLKDKTSLKSLGEAVEITTPFLDRHNDFVQIYTRRENGHFILTDDGYTLGDLTHSGCNLDTPKRQQLLKMTLNGFGISLHDDRLEVNSTEETFAAKKHNLVQAMLAVNDLFYLSAPVVTSIFYEDVVAWLDLYEIRYTENLKFSGKSGFDHHFDFVIPKSSKMPERILKTINSPNKSQTSLLFFAWMDTRETRPPDSKPYALLNDSEKPVPALVDEALKNYGVTSVPWSRREEFREALAS